MAWIMLGKNHAILESYNEKKFSKKMKKLLDNAIINDIIPYNESRFP